MLLIAFLILLHLQNEMQNARHKCQECLSPYSMLLAHMGLLIPKVMISGPVHTQKIIKKNKIM
jgi:hypothetical protein